MKNPKHKQPAPENDLLRQLFLQLAKKADPQIPGLVEMLEAAAPSSGPSSPAPAIPAAATTKTKPKK